MDSPKPRKTNPVASPAPAIEAGSPGGAPTRKPARPAPPRKLPRNARVSDLSAADEAQSLTAEDISYGKQQD